MALISGQKCLAVPVLLVLLLAVTSVFALNGSYLSVANYGTIIYSAKAYQSELRGVLIKQLTEYSHNDTLICETLSKYGFNAVYLEVNAFSWTGYVMSSWQDMIKACAKFNITFHVLLIINEGSGSDYVDSAESSYPYGFTGHRSSWMTSFPNGTLADTMSFSASSTRDRVKQVVQAMLTYFPAVADINLDYIRYTNSNFQVPYDNASRGAFLTWMNATGRTFTGNWPDYYYGGSHWRDFAQWRCIPINDLVRDVRAWAQAIKPTVAISADTFTPFAGWTPDHNMDVVGQDVAYWISQGYLDWVDPMNYVSTLADLQTRVNLEATYWFGQQPEGAIPIVSFITQGGPGADVESPIDNATFLSQINWLRQRSNGFIMYIYDGPGFNPGVFTNILPYLQLVNQSSTLGTFATFDQSRPSISGSVITWVTTKTTNGSVEYSTSPIFPAVPHAGTALDYVDINYSAGTVITSSTATTQHIFTVPISPPFYYRVIDNDSHIVLASPVYLVTG